MRKTRPGHGDGKDQGSTAHRSCATLSSTISNAVGPPNRSLAVWTYDTGAPVISHETIYRFIYAQLTRTNDSTWRNYLPRAKTRRGYRGHKGGSPANFIKDRVSIHHRPQDAEDRSALATGNPTPYCSQSPASPFSLSTTETPASSGPQGLKTEPQRQPPVSSLPFSNRFPSLPQNLDFRQRNRVLTPRQTSPHQSSRPSSVIPTPHGRKVQSKTLSDGCDGSCPERLTLQISMTPTSMPASAPTTIRPENASSYQPRQRSSASNCCTSNVNPPPDFRRDDRLLFCIMSLQ